MKEKIEKIKREKMKNMKMRVIGNENGLKGQYNLAQGDTPSSFALGWRTGTQIVRAMTFLKGLSLFRTIRYEFNSVRRALFALFIVFARTVSLHIPISQGEAQG
jgi:hypothetical protein